MLSILQEETTTDENLISPLENFFRGILGNYFEFSVILLFVLIIVWLILYAIDELFIKPMLKENEEEIINNCIGCNEEYLPDDNFCVHCGKKR